MTLMRITLKFRTLVTIFLSLGIFAFLPFKNHAASQNKKIEAIQSMNMKTMCVGRLAIEVPANAIANFRDAGVAGWDISTDAEETEEAFERRLKDKELNVRGGDPSRRRGGIESIIEIKEPDRHGKILVFGRAESFDEDNGKRKKLEWIAMHAFVRLNGVSYTLSSDFRDVGDVAELRRLATNLRHRENEKMPEVPGLCIDRAVIPDPLPNARQESATVLFELPGHPDARLVLTSLARVKTDKSLLERSALSSVKRKYASRFHFLRQQKRVIASWDGEEIVKRVHELNGTTVRSAFWEFGGSKEDLLKPHISLEFRTGLGQPGEPVNSTFTDEELLAFWDKVSSSLRIRSDDPSADPRLP